MHTHASSMSPSCSDCITATPYESPAQLERHLRDQPRRWCGGIGGTGPSAWPLCRIANQQRSRLANAYAGIPRSTTGCERSLNGLRGGPAHACFVKCVASLSTSPPHLSVTVHSPLAARTPAPATRNIAGPRNLHRSARMRYPAAPVLWASCSGGAAETHMQMLQHHTRLQRRDGRLLLRLKRQIRRPGPTARRTASGKTRRR